MKLCINCQKEIDEAMVYCPHCGEDQRITAVQSDKRASSSFLTVLCILTIIGSIFTIGRAYLYEMVSMMDGNHNYYRGWIYALSSIGTLVGAWLMLQKKRKGLIVYTLFQTVYIITVIIASLSYTDTIFGGQSDTEVRLLASGIAMFFLLPSLLFLILYWTPMIKKNFE